MHEPEETFGREASSPSLDGVIPATAYASPQLIRRMVAAIGGSEQADLNWDFKAVWFSRHELHARQILLSKPEGKRGNAVSLSGHGHLRGG